MRRCLVKSLLFPVPLFFIRNALSCIRGMVANGFAVAALSASDAFLFLSDSLLDFIPVSLPTGIKYHSVIWKISYFSATFVLKQAFQLNFFLTKSGTDFTCFPTCLQHRSHCTANQRFSHRKSCCSHSRPHDICIWWFKVNTSIFPKSALTMARDFWSDLLPVYEVSVSFRIQEQ